MNILSVATLFTLAVLAAADFREKRQVDYQFPQPRGREAQPQDDSALYQVPRRQFQAQPVQPYAPPPPPPQQRAPAQSYAPQPQTRRAPQPSRTQYAAEQPRGRRPPADEEEEEEKGPDPLALLLQGSKFACTDRKDGYYADSSVGCQAFHYCVGGARHSWMCPENTVFHQVHLNCVPASQDICGQSEKYHFVNDYLHKELEQRGPNNSVVYAQRYYPEGYSVGDDFHAPNSPPRDNTRYVDDEPRYAPQPQAQPAYRQPAPAPAPQPAYRQPAPAPQPRPYSPPQQSRPTYSQPAPQQAPPQFAQSYGQAPPQGRPLPVGVPVQQAPPRRAPQHSQGSRAAAVSPYAGYPPQGGVRYDDDQY